MGLQLDLQKSATSLRLSLEKAGLATLPDMEVCFDLDVSGSYEDEHKDGITNDIMTRLVPWGLVFDPDKKLDVFTFSNGRAHAHYVGEVTGENYDGYVRRYIIGKVPGWNGGTTYADVLRKNLQHFGWIAESAEAPQKRGMFGKWSGSSAPAPVAESLKPRKAIVLFNTDGDNSDQRETDALFAEMEAEGYGIYVNFIAVSNQGGRFPFINRMADKYNNVGITVIRDVRRWVQKSDDEINAELIGPELVEWLKV